VVDNNSSDHTREVVDDFGRRYLDRFRHLFVASGGEGEILLPGLPSTRRISLALPAGPRPHSRLDTSRRLPVAACSTLPRMTLGRRTRGPGAARWYRFMPCTRLGLSISIFDPFESLD
jgi:hypothetical protein